MMKRVPVPEYGPLAMRYIKLAELYDSIGNQQQVEAVLKEVDSMSEGELAVGFARAGIRRNHSDKMGAERILRELSENYPTNYEVLVELGGLQADLGQNQQALISYQRAAEGWIASPQLHASIAKTLLALGRGREALDQCRLGEAMAPRNWAIKFSCAQVRSAVESK
jgi:predicted Zn-dependent protease